MTSLSSQSPSNPSTAAVQSLLDCLLASHQFDPAQIKTDPESLEYWGKDWTKHFAPAASAIVFPKTTEQVQAIVLLANEHNIVLTPSGGRTGLSAGAVAANGEIVVSMDKMSQIGTFYPADRMVEIEAGVITEQLHQFAESRLLTTLSTLPQRAPVKSGATSAPTPAASRSSAMACPSMDHGAHRRHR